MPDNSQVLLKLEEVLIKKRRLSFMYINPGSFPGKDLLFLHNQMYFLTRVLTNSREKFLLLFSNLKPPKKSERDIRL